MCRLQRRSDLNNRKEVENTLRVERDRNVSTRKGAQAALRGSEFLYRALFDAIESGLCVVEVDLDATGGRIDYRVVEANPAFYRQTGFPGVARPHALAAKLLRNGCPMAVSQAREVHSTALSCSRRLRVSL